MKLVSYSVGNLSESDHKIVSWYWGEKPFPPVPFNTKKTAVYIPQMSLRSATCKIVLCYEIGEDPAYRRCLNASKTVKKKNGKKTRNKIMYLHIVWLVPL